MAAEFSHSLDPERTFNKSNLAPLTTFDHDADVVLVIEPDDLGTAGALEKQALFYVAATRAKEHLIVLRVDGANRSTPILDDAATTASVLAQ